MKRESPQSSRTASDSEPFPLHWSPKFSLGLKLFVSSAFVIILTAVLVAAITLRESRQTILQEAIQHALSIVRERRSRLETWMEGRARSAEASAASDIVLRALNLTRSRDPHAPSVASLAIKQINRRLHHDQAIRFIGLYDRAGAVVSFQGDSAIAAAIARSPELRQALNGHSSFGDIHLGMSGIPVINLVAHVHDNDGEVVGVYAYQYETAFSIDPILADTTGLGMSGESFLVNADTMMITPSRFHAHPGVLQHKMKLPSIEAALRGDTGVMIYRGLLDHELVGAYTYIPGQRWAMVTEMNLVEAYAPLRRIIINSIVAAGWALLMMLGIAFLLTRTLTRPLEALTEASASVAKGDFSVFIPGKGKADEIGLLVRSFNRMVESLEQSRRMLRESQSRLIQSEKLAAVGTLVASVVHEMRNPLSAIRMNLKLLERKAGQGRTGQSEEIAIASEEVLRLEEMLSGLLDYSKPANLAANLASLNDVMGTAIKRVAVDADTAGINLVMTDPIPDAAIETDPEQLTRALVNLLSNAIQASKPGDSVKLGCLADNDKIFFSVEDTGKGIPQSIINRIYDPFFTTRDRGIGLGMSSVKKFVELSGGDIKIESAEGRGTRVRIILPMRITSGDSISHR